MKMVESIGCHSCFVHADVSDIEQMNRLKDEMMKRFGRIDILVNKAGFTRDKSFVKMTPEMWKNILAVNLDGALNCTKLVLK